MKLKKKLLVTGYIGLLSVFLMNNCAPAPDVLSEPGTETPTSVVPPVSPEFEMKSYHEAMMEEMRISMERSDEILVGEYTGSHADPQVGRIHYFDDFKSFDKTTMSWGPPMKVIVEVQAKELSPEIIKRGEYARLSDLDKVGICWDPYQGSRYIYLVEGQQMLLFLQTGYDEINNRSYRNMIDAYPVTSVCRADEIFNTLIK